jgi:hypothetical protein
MTERPPHTEPELHPAFYRAVRRWALLVFGLAILLYECLTPGDARALLGLESLALLGLNETVEMFAPRFRRG